MQHHDLIAAQRQAFSLFTGVANTQVITNLITTNVIEILGEGSKKVEELATECKLNKNVLARTLRYASFIGVVNFDDDKYSLSETGKCFLQEHPGSLKIPGSFIGSAPWRDAWNNFRYSLETGEPAFDHAFGMPYFDYLDSHKDFGGAFNDYMTEMTSRIIPAIIEVYDFSGFDSICDVGGGQGTLLKAVLETAPKAKGILFDMESAVTGNVLGETASRTQIIPGSFFDDIPAADCLLLKSIIHDWNDENALKILMNCRKALKKDGRILLIEQVVEKPYNARELFYDLHMQVMLGGAERTEKEFGTLFESAGLELNLIIPTKSQAKIIEIVVLD
ncbi:MAG: methyltransferase [Bacteroidota bacterium]|nr:methyltransferase [Bacteroidota bacterium]